MSNKLEMPNEIRKIDEKTPLQLGQNFEAIVSAFNSLLNIVEGIDIASWDALEFEANAITYGPEEPTD
jgi:hypothetical protein